MTVTNIEFKAYCDEHERIKRILSSLNSRYVGEDHQVDTYFDVRVGRLKLREGTIERNLIYYERADRVGPKRSSVRLVSVGKEEALLLKTILTEALGIKTVVDKRRHIFFLDNIKVHLDTVEKLGTFVEVEAIDEDGTIGAERLRMQCQDLFERLGLTNESLVAHSYSDMLLF